MKEKMQTARGEELKLKKKTVESVLESISNVESALTLAVAEGNKRAELSAENVLIGLKAKLKALKSKD